MSDGDLPPYRDPIGLIALDALIAALVMAALYWLVFGSLGLMAIVLVQGFPFVLAIYLSAVVAGLLRRARRDSMRRMPPSNGRRTLLLAFLLGALLALLVIMAQVGR